MAGAPAQPIDPGISLRYPGLLPLFTEHLPGKPVVPGAMLLGDLIGGVESSWPTRGHTLRTVAFRRFVVPDETYTWRPQPAGHWSLQRGDDVFASATLEAFGVDDEPIGATAGEEAVVPAGFRSPLLRFFEAYARTPSVLSTRVRVGDVMQRLPYLEGSSEPALYVLLETAGNLALLSQCAPGLELTAKSPINEFGFVKLGRIAYCPPADDRALLVAVTARMVAHYLVWDADAWCPRGQRVLSCRKAVSMRMTPDV